MPATVSGSVIAPGRGDQVASRAQVGRGRLAGRDGARGDVVLAGTLTLAWT